MVTIAEQTLLHQSVAPHRVASKPAHLTQAEHSVDFDHYMIVYSDHLACEMESLSPRSPITALVLGHNCRSGLDEPFCAGETSIGCYSRDRLVDTINFYGPSEWRPRSSVDADGVILLWFPLTCFAHILNILHQEKHRSLSRVCKGLDGTDLEPPMGALLTWREPTGN